MHTVGTLDFEPARLRAIVALLGLDTEHGEPRRQLRDALAGGRAEALVDACLARLAHVPDFSRLENGDFSAAFRQGGVDYLHSLGEDFNAPGRFAARMAFSAACAHAGVPLGLAHLQHSLIQQAVLEQLAAGGCHAQNMPSLTAYVMMRGALEIYLMTEGYRTVEIDALKKALDESREEVFRLRRKASTDELTGLVNFTSLMEELERQIQTAGKRNHPLCVMMADLDFFKRVNDSHGHLVGDTVLRHAAERIRAAVRDFDTVGRFGGEEFTVILANTDIDMARIIAERIREDVAAEPFHVHGLNIGITISVGGAMLRKDETKESLLERADAAMYEAKQSGRNRVVFAAP